VRWLNPEGRAPDVAAIAVAGPRGVDDTVLLAASCADGEAELHRIILASAERKRLGPLFRRKQQSYNVGTDPLCW
jgi:hypothetical protein